MADGPGVLGADTKPKRTRLYAADVARNYADAAGAQERSAQEEITWVAMEIAEHLAERGTPGEWDRINGTALGFFVLTGDLGDRIPFLNHLGRMLLWLTEQLLIPYDDTVRIMTDLHRTLKRCRMTQRLLDQPLARLMLYDMDTIRRRRAYEKNYFIIPQIITDPPQWDVPNACETNQPDPQPTPTVDAHTAGASEPTENQEPMHPPLPKSPQTPEPDPEPGAPTNPIYEQTLTDRTLPITTAEDPPLYNGKPAEPPPPTEPKYIQGPILNPALPPRPDPDPWTNSSHAPREGSPRKIPHQTPPSGRFPAKPLPPRKTVATYCPMARPHVGADHPQGGVKVSTGVPSKRVASRGASTAVSKTDEETTVANDSNYGAQLRVA